MTITISGIPTQSQPQSSSQTAGSGAVDERFLAALKRSLAESGFGDVEVVVGASDAAPASDSTADSTEARSSSSGTPVPVSPFQAASLGPQITRSMWTDELLTGDLTQDMLKQVCDPAGLLRARLEMVQHDTGTAITALDNGASQPVNSAQLSTHDQAQKILDRIRGLGFDDAEIAESEPVGGMYRVDYGDENYRYYTINGLNVGLLMERYAKNTVEMADTMTLDELRPQQTSVAS